MSSVAAPSAPQALPSLREVVGGATPPPRRHWTAAPMLSPLLAAVGGIAADRVTAVPLVGWWLLAGTGWIGWLVVHQSSRIAAPAVRRMGAGLLWVAVGAAFAAAHHQQWNTFRREELAFGLDHSPRPVCVEAVVCSRGRVIPPPPPEPLAPMELGPRWQAAVEVTAVRDGAAWRPAAGRATLVGDGDLPALGAGDRLRIVAQAARLAPPANPGSFDFARHARGDRELFRLSVPAPECVQTIGSARWHWRRPIDALRAWGESRLRQHVSQSQQPLAAALLLGLREQVDLPVRDELLRTGTIHLLAISGLHVAILAGSLSLALRMGWLPRRTALLLVAGVTVLYALVTDAQPPVVRATILVLLFCAAQLLGRALPPVNGLATAALVVLLLNPADLFRTGAQLSFLAVAAILAVAPLLPQPSNDPLQIFIREAQPWPRRALHDAAWRGMQTLMLSAGIWLAVLPATAGNFHLVSPVGVVLNPLLLVPVSLALVSALGVAVLGWIPPLGAVLGGACSMCLECVAGLVRWGGRIPGGYHWVATPAAWWMPMTYLLALVVVAAPGLRRRRRWLAALVVAWLAASGYAWAPPRPRGQLETTFLAVGHGGCIVMELPDGQTWLYDAGRLGPPRGGVQTIAGFLWSRGCRRLDGVVVSHADLDHYNALPGLLERFDLRRVYVAEAFLRAGDPGCAVLQEAFAEHGVPVEVVAAGDELRPCEGVSLRVLHPDNRPLHGSDNAASLVLQVDYRGSRLLLTGDLESPGLERLLERPPQTCEVLLVPHHGSPRSRPEAVAAWCKPRYAVISSGPITPATTRTMDAYRRAGAEVFATAASGAVHFELGESVRVHTHGAQ